MAHPDDGGAAGGVLEGVRQGLLHDPVGHQLGAAGRLRRRALLGELHRLPGPAGPLHQRRQPVDGPGRRPGPGAVVGVEQFEQVAQVGDRPPAGVGDGGQRLVQAVGRRGQVPRGLGLHDHRRHMVGDHVVELAGDAGALGGAGVLGDAAAQLGLRGPGGAQPRPGAPDQGQRQVERRELAHRLPRAEPQRARPPARRTPRRTAARWCAGRARGARPRSAARSAARWWRRSGSRRAGRRRSRARPAARQTAGHRRRTASGKHSRAIAATPRASTGRVGTPPSWVPLLLNAGSSDAARSSSPRGRSRTATSSRCHSPSARRRSITGAA